VRRNDFNFIACSNTSFTCESGPFADGQGVIHSLCPLIMGMLVPILLTTVYQCTVSVALFC